MTWERSVPTLVAANPWHLALLSRFGAAVLTPGTAARRAALSASTRSRRICSL